MANRKNPTPVIPPVQAASADPPAHVVSLRLPENLSAAARTCSALCGISLNALVCVALADYLDSKGYNVHSGKITK